MYDVYTVNDNDTLESISMKLNIAPKVLSSLNNNITEVTKGTTLLIPKNNSLFFDYYKVSIGDTLYNIAKKYNTNTSILAILNGLNIDDYIYSNQIIMVPKENVRIYVTAEGDTLQNILSGLNVDISKFFNQNNNLYLLPEQLIVYKDN